MMKYLTKEWYWAMQCDLLFYGLRANEEARVFSEELFQRLYAECEQEFLDQEKRLCDVDLEELADGLSNAPVQHVDGTPLTEEEYEEAITVQENLAQSLKEIPERIFDPDIAKTKYHKRYLTSLENAQNKLPDEIKQKIADMRVFALKYAAPEIIEEVTAYSDACSKIVEQTSRECCEAQNALFRNNEPPFFDQYAIHDYRVKSAHFCGNDFILEASYNKNLRYTFKNAEILVQEHALDGAILLYDEIYPCEAGYEFHFLIYLWENDEVSLFYLTLQCSDLEITLENKP